MDRPSEVQLLIVDDDEVDVRAVQRGLVKLQIANPIVVACDGQEALDLLRGTNGQPALKGPLLIVLDLNMPRMNGLEFLKLVREDAALASSVIFVLTTSNNDEERAAAYRHHVAGYILKRDAGPGFAHLAQLIERYLTLVQFPPPRR